MTEKSGSAEKAAPQETPAPAPANATSASSLPPLTGAQFRALRSRAQLMKATLKIGRDGLSAGFFAALDDLLSRHELVKVKFDAFKEEKKELTPQLAEKAAAHLVTRVGNVVVLYRPKPAVVPAGS